MTHHRVLFLCARLPYPCDTGSKLRAFHLLRSLCNHHDVTLLTFAAPGQQRQPLALLREMCHRVELVVNDQMDGNSVSLAGKSMITGLPYTTLKYQQPQLAQRMSQLLQQERFDVIHCEHLQMGQYLAQAPAMPAILDEHNIDSLLWKRMTASARGLRRLFFKTQRWLIQRFEADMCGRADGVICCSEQDRRWILQNTPQRDVWVVPNGVDSEAMQRTGQHDCEASSLVFVGSMDWKPNADGIDRFLQQIWPGLKNRVPGVRMYVVGRRPSTKLQQQARNDPQLVVTGGVPDVRPYIERATAYVVPLYVGGGTRLKILEAFSMEKCVISTTLGAEGITYTSGDNMLIADDDQAFVATVAEILANPDRAKAIGQAARQLAVRSYDWSAIGDHYSEILVEVAAGRPSARSFP